MLVMFSNLIELCLLGGDFNSLADPLINRRNDREHTNKFPKAIEAEFHERFAPNLRELLERHMLRHTCDFH